MSESAADPHVSTEFFRSWEAAATAWTDVVREVESHGNSFGSSRTGLWTGRLLPGYKIWGAWSALKKTMESSCRQVEVCRAQAQIETAAKASLVAAMGSLLNDMYLLQREIAEASAQEPAEQSRQVMSSIVRLVITFNNIYLNPIRMALAAERPISIFPS